MNDGRLAHVEAAVNTVAGIILAQIVLFIWGMRFMEAAGLNVTFLVVSYARMYIIRRIFAARATKQDLLYKPPRDNDEWETIDKDWFR